MFDNNEIQRNLYFALLPSSSTSLWAVKAHEVEKRRSVVRRLLIERDLVEKWLWQYAQLIVCTAMNRGVINQQHYKHEKLCTARQVIERICSGATPAASPTIAHNATSPCALAHMAYMESIPVTYLGHPCDRQMFMSQLTAIVRALARPFIESKQLEADRMKPKKKRGAADRKIWQAFWKPIPIARANILCSSHTELSDTDADDEADSTSVFEPGCSKWYVSEEKLELPFSPDGDDDCDDSVGGILGAAIMKLLGEQESNVDTEVDNNREVYPGCGDKCRDDLGVALIQTDVVTNDEICTSHGDDSIAHPTEFPIFKTISIQTDPNSSAIIVDEFNHNSTATPIPIIKKDANDNSAILDSASVPISTFYDQFDQMLDDILGLNTSSSTTSKSDSTSTSTSSSDEYDVTDADIHLQSHEYFLTRRDSSNPKQHKRVPSVIALDKVGCDVVAPQFSLKFRPSPKPKRSRTNSHRSTLEQILEDENELDDDNMASSSMSDVTNGMSAPNSPVLQPSSKATSFDSEELLLMDAVTLYGCHMPDSQPMRKVRARSEYDIINAVEYDRMLNSLGQDGVPPLWRMRDELGLRSRDALRRAMRPMKRSVHKVLRWFTEPFSRRHSTEGVHRAGV